MVTFIGVLSFLGIIIGAILSIRAVFTKQSKKRPLLITGISFIIAVGAVSLSTSSPKLEIDKQTIETNTSGVATIKGKTNENSQLTVDGEKIQTKDGNFTYKVTLKNDQTKKLTFVVSVGDADKAETVEVKPSKAFVAFLNEEKQDQEAIESAETALTLAESKPTRKNYNEAATLITSLTKEQADLTERLAIVKDNVPIHEAVELAETKQTKENLDSATALVAKATLNKADLSKRLATVQHKITEKETTEKQIAAARAAVEKAEQEPSDEHYNEAIAKINEIPNGNEELTGRANKIKQTLTAQKEEVQKHAEAQKKAEQEAAAQQAQAAAETPAPNTQETGEMVLVTATGSKYHNRKCGNGTYTPATLEEAQARGLTPCSKCY